MAGRREADQRGEFGDHATAGREVAIGKLLSGQNFAAMRHSTRSEAGVPSLQR